jgi:hypothetical protein
MSNDFLSGKPRPLTADEYFAAVAREWRVAEAGYDNLYLLDGEILVNAEGLRRLAAAHGPDAVEKVEEWIATGEGARCVLKAWS